MIWKYSCNRFNVTILIELYEYLQTFAPTKLPITLILACNFLCTVRSHVISLTNINTKYGYIGVDRAKLLSVTPPIAKRSLSALIRSVMCSPEYQFRYAVLEKSYKTLMSYDGKPFSVGKAVVAPITDRTIGIYKSLNHDDSLKSKTPIRPGETILWENRWEIQLKPKTTNSQLQEQYFVRNMGRKEYEFATRGIRRIRSTPLPPVSARSSLPVITDAAGRVLLIPHFQFAERNVTISARVSFEPKYSVEDVLLNHWSQKIIIIVWYHLSVLCWKCFHPVPR